MKTVHYIQIALGAVVAAAQSVAMSDPNLANICHTVSVVCAAILPVLGVVSASALPQNQSKGGQS